MSRDLDLMRPVQGLPGIPVGTVVMDVATGVKGLLMDVRPLPDLNSLPPSRHAHTFAFIRAIGGGAEWTTEPEQVVRAGQP